MGRPKGSLNKKTVMKSKPVEIVHKRRGRKPKIEAEIENFPDMILKDMCKICTHVINNICFETSETWRADNMESKATCHKFRKIEGA